MTENSKPQFSSPLPDGQILSLQDFLLDQGAVKSDYLSVSVTRSNGVTQIKITTTDAAPITYTAVVPHWEIVDLTVLQFVAQREKEITPREHLDQA